MPITYTIEIETRDCCEACSELIQCCPMCPRCRYSYMQYVIPDAGRWMLDEMEVYSRLNDDPLSFRCDDCDLTLTCITPAGDRDAWEPLEWVEA